jgi:hypothetical protein
MTAFIAALAVYLLFIIQSLLPAGGPNLVLAATIAVALHEKKLAATALGLWGGFLLDLTAPSFSGSGMLVLALAGYAVASLRVVLYRAGWVLPAAAALSQVCLLVVLALAGSSLPAILPTLVSFTLTVLFSIPLGALVSRLVYRP